MRSGPLLPLLPAFPQHTWPTVWPLRTSSNKEGLHACQQSKWPPRTSRNKMFAMHVINKNDRHACQQKNFATHVKKQYDLLPCQLHNDRHACMYCTVQTQNWRYASQKTNGCHASNKKNNLHWKSWWLLWCEPARLLHM